MVLANLYYDFNRGSRFNPYIGVGLGSVYHQVNAGTTQTGGMIGEASDWHVAGAAIAGVSLSPCTTASISMPAIASSISARPRPAASRTASATPARPDGRGHPCPRVPLRPALRHPLTGVTIYEHARSVSAVIVAAREVHRRRSPGSPSRVAWVGCVHARPGRDVEGTRPVPAAAMPALRAGRQRIEAGSARTGRRSVSTRGIDAHETEVCQPDARRWPRSAGVAARRCRRLRPHAPPASAWSSAGGCRCRHPSPCPTCRALWYCR